MIRSSESCSPSSPPPLSVNIKQNGGLISCRSQSFGNWSNISYQSCLFNVRALCFDVSAQERLCVSTVCSVKTSSCSTRQTLNFSTSPRWDRSRWCDTLPTVTSAPDGGFMQLLKPDRFRFSLTRQRTWAWEEGRSQRACEEEMSPLHLVCCSFPSPVPLLRKPTRGRAGVLSQSARLLCRFPPFCDLTSLRVRQLLFSLHCLKKLDFHFFHSLCGNVRRIQSTRPSVFFYWRYIWHSSSAFVL